MSRKREYRVFLQSPFWLELTARKKESVGGKCEDCGKSEYLQSHHIEYPEDWYDTTPDQLKVLCRWCHAKVHGKAVSEFRKYMLHRDDEKFSRILWRVDGLTRLIYEGYRLKPRDLRFLNLVIEAFPPTPKDSCMSFHVNNCLRISKLNFKEP